MDGDQDRADNEAGAEPSGATMKAPDGSAHQEVSNRQPTISEKALVDRINRSDFWMIILTAAIAFSGVVSAIIFGWQLIAMNGQLNEMRATREGGDKSMTDQLAVMRDQAKAMLGQISMMDQQIADARQSRRAFITAADYKIARVDDDDAAKSCWTFQAIITNVGDTPTQDLHYINDIVFDELPLPGEQGSAYGMVLAPLDPDGIYHKATGWPGALLGPKQNLPSTPTHKTFCLTKDTTASMWVHLRIFARGVIHYRDTYPGSPDHVTKYCFWLPGELDKGVYVPRPTICSHWNCADEECDRDKANYATELANDFATTGQTMQPLLEFYQ